MKLVTNVKYPRKAVTPEEAVTYVINEHVCSYRSDGTGELETIKLRHDALESIVGRLLGALIDNGALRAEQVSAIFDHDVSAED